MLMKYCRRRHIAPGIASLVNSLCRQVFRLTSLHALLLFELTSLEIYKLYHQSCLLQIYVLLKKNKQLLGLISRHGIIFESDSCSI